MTSAKLSYLPKPLPPITIPLGVWVSAYELWGNTNVQSITQSYTSFLGQSSSSLTSASIQVLATASMGANPKQQRTGQSIAGICSG